MRGGWADECKPESGGGWMQTRAGVTHYGFRTPSRDRGKHVEPQKELPKVKSEEEKEATEKNDLLEDASFLKGVKDEEEGVTEEDFKGEHECDRLNRHVAMDRIGDPFK
jgi:hypothetical protein